MLNQLYQTMYKSFYALLLSLFILNACDNGVEEKMLQQKALQEEIQLVKAAFTKYQMAVLSQDGYEAMKCLNQKTIDFYDDILDKVRYASKTDIKLLSDADKMQVLAVRRFFTEELIFDLTGITLCAASIREGLFSTQHLKAMSIGRVATKQNKAKAQMILDGKQTPIFFDFSKEDNEWKIDLTTTFIITSKYLENEAKKLDLSTSDYILEILQLSDEEKVSIFEPLRTRE